MERSSLSRDQIRSILSLYHLEALEDFGGIDASERNRVYWVRVGGRKYVLRVIERTNVDDLVYEKELLLHLGRYDLPVPRLMRNVARGTFTPWAARGRFVSLFEQTDGRELGLFELRPRHARSIGRFAAHMHLATASFRRSRGNDSAVDVLDERVSRLEQALRRRRLPRRVASDLLRIRTELDRQATRSFLVLPHGTVHGSLTTRHTRWREQQLVGVLGFESSCADRLLWELAVSLNDWCWQPSAQQKGGPAGRYNLARLRALVAGYTSVRPLEVEEWSSLEDEMKLAAIASSVACLAEHEVTRGSEVPGGVYRDYRHGVARLAALEAGAARPLLPSTRALKARK